MNNPAQEFGISHFQRVRQRLVDDVHFAHPWVCKTGFWPTSKAPQAAVFKLLKKHWSPDSSDETGDSSIGVFFSVWMDAPAIAKGGLHYNLHALKLGQLPGHRLESRKFASAFREAFRAMPAVWPEVDTRFGPQTLFQGFAKCLPERIEETTRALATKFAPVGYLVDQLLADAAKPTRTH